MGSVEKSHARDLSTGKQGRPPAHSATYKILIVSDPREDLRAAVARADLQQAYLEDSRRRVARDEQANRERLGGAVRVFLEVMREHGNPGLAPVYAATRKNWRGVGKEEKKPGWIVCSGYAPSTGSGDSTIGLTVFADGTTSEDLRTANGVNQAADAIDVERFLDGLGATLRDHGVSV